MSNSENPIQPLFTSTSSVSNGGTDRPAALVSLNLPAVQQALNLSTSIDFDSRSPAPSSLTTTSPEQPPTREKKSYIATNHPNSHSTHDPPEPNRSENCASKEEAVFSKRADRNSLYFPPGASLLKSPGAGISSSVGVPAAECTTENATHSESFINFTGLTIPWRNLLSVFSPFESNSQTTPIGYEIDNSSASAASGIQTPLSSMTHTARLSKLHSKSGFRFSEAFTPLLFQGTHIFPAESITACLYSNQFWLDRVPDFVRSWDGPVSLVVESFSTDRPKLITRIQEMRKNIPSIRKSVDFHIVLVPDGSSTQKLKNAQRMMAEPIATNAQLNVARFFSRSELVWLAGDARVLPSTGLYDVLTKQTNLRTRVLDYGNAIVIPSFAFSRAKQVNPNTFQWTGEEADLNQMAQQYINESILSIALPSHKWPSTREDLLRLTTQSDSPKPDMSAMAMYDQAWKPSEGPTNWTMWQTFVPKLDSGASRIMDSAKTLQGDLSGVQDQMYPVVSYDLNYAPNVIVSREGQPWCTERFEYNKAACVYQMYLAGTELWVMPEAWSLTFQQMPSTSKRFDEDRELKELISARLYSKFHQEACMHYGREFSSLGTWEKIARNMPGRIASLGHTPKRPYASISLVGIQSSIHLPKPQRSSCGWLHFLSLTEPAQIPLGLSSGDIIRCTLSWALYQPLPTFSMHSSSQDGHQEVPTLNFRRRKASGPSRPFPPGFTPVTQVSPCTPDQSRTAALSSCHQHCVHPYLHQTEAWQWRSSRREFIGW
ncbi:hypothetical protein H4Q26_000711 [Puccinia striiformis f. sp. tritici PST-130]|nr:hypothetical protein H4Q26_000711 [Puccinia striiformis f. sp. tritici PST-130]